MSKIEPVQDTHEKIFNHIVGKQRSASEIIKREEELVKELQETLLRMFEPTIMKIIEIVKKHHDKEPPCAQQ